MKKQYIYTIVAVLVLSASAIVFGITKNPTTISNNTKQAQQTGMLVKYSDKKTNVKFSYPRVLGSLSVNKYSVDTNQTDISFYNENDPIASKLTLSIADVLASDFSGVQRGGIMSGVQFKKVNEETVIDNDKFIFKVNTYQVADNGKFIIEGIYLYKGDGSSEPIEIAYMKNSQNLTVKQLGTVRGYIEIIGRSLVFPL